MKVFMASPQDSHWRTEFVLICADSTEEARKHLYQNGDDYVVTELELKPGVMWEYEHCPDSRPESW